MKKIFTFFAFCFMLLAFVSCEKSTGTDLTKYPLYTYEKDVKPVLVTNCAPCHLAGSAVNSNKWDDYTQAKNKVLNILDRTQRVPGTQGFMPRNRTVAIPSSEIDKIKRWQVDGLLER
jgi:hypothetical protein